MIQSTTEAFGYAYLKIVHVLVIKKLTIGFGLVGPDDARILADSGMVVYAQSILNEEAA